MPTATQVEAPERHNYPLRTPVQMHRRVKRVAAMYGMSYNAAVCLLIAEALEARQIPEEE